MTARLVALGLALVGAASAALGQSQALAPTRPPQSPRLDWYEIDRSVANTLFGRELADALASLPSIESTVEPEHLFRALDYFVRAGHRSQARSAIEKLATLADSGSPQAAANLADFLVGRQDWELARLVLERFPDAQPGWGYVFIKHWADSGDAREIDRWLESQSRGDRQYWFDERVRFRESLGTADRLMDSLAVDLRAHPTDMVKATRYVHAATNYRAASSLDWVGSVARPGVALDAYRLGVDLLANARSPAGAALLFERSLALPYTSEDQRRLDEMALRWMAVRLTRPSSWEETLRRWATIGLIEAYTKAGQAERAQPLLEKIATAGDDGIPAFGLSQLAGTVQRESGKHVIEQRIAAAEDANKDSVKYWLSRAAYYTGRSDSARTVAAYERALALAAPERAGPVDRLHARYTAVNDYARFLNGPNGFSLAGAGFALIWREFSAADPGSEYASWLASDIAQRSTDNERLVSRIPDPMAERRLWDYIEARAVWRMTEERLIQRLIEHLPENERGASLTRLMALAGAGDPARQRSAAEVLLRLNDAPRAIPLLRSYIDHAPESHDRELAKLTLFTTYLDHTADWRAAETAFPGARQLLTPAELTDYIARLAIVAAKAGATTDAFRMWRIAANIDRADLRHLGALGSVPGMRVLLMDYYQQLAKQDPGSWVPTVALRAVGAR